MIKFREFLSEATLDKEKYLIPFLNDYLAGKELKIGKNGEKSIIPITDKNINNLIFSDEKLQEIKKNLQEINKIYNLATSGQLSQAFSLLKDEKGRYKKLFCDEKTGNCYKWNEFFKGTYSKSIGKEATEFELEFAIYWNLYINEKYNLNIPEDKIGKIAQENKSDGKYKFAIQKYYANKEKIDLLLEKISKEIKKDFKTDKFFLSNFGASKQEVSKIWKQFGKSKSEPKTDLYSVDFTGKQKYNVKISLKNDDSQIMSGNLEETQATFFAVLDNDEKLRNEIIEMIANYMVKGIKSSKPISKIKKMSPTEIKKLSKEVQDEINKILEIDKKHQELSKYLNDLFDKNTELKLKFIFEGITGNLKFGKNSIASANSILAISKDLTKYHFKKIETLKDIPSNITNKLKFYVAFKTAGKSWSTLRVGIEKMFKESVEEYNLIYNPLLEINENILVEGFLSNIVNKIFKVVKNFFEKIKNKLFDLFKVSIKANIKYGDLFK